MYSRTEFFAIIVHILNGICVVMSHSFLEEIHMYT